MALTHNDAKIKELQDLDKKHYLHPTSSVSQQQANGPAFIAAKGEGIYVTDVQGDRYIDGLSQLWNVNIGHGRKEMAEAARKQMETLAYSNSFLNFSHEPVIRLAEKLASLTPGDLNVCFFTSSGSEANDTAYKLIRHYWQVKGEPKRTKIIGRERGYHGNTIGATSATGIPQFHDMSPAKAPDFLHAAAAFHTACERGDQTDPAYATSIRGIIEAEGPETIAAVIVEPIQCASGIHIPPDGYLQAVRQLCDEYGILLIADEVICGFGRTGKMFGVENWQVVPDVMTVAKGITSGYLPLGAVIMRERLRDELAEHTTGVLFHGFTYSGHPASCAVALKNIEILESDQLLVNAKQMEEELHKGLRYLRDNHRTVTRTRALGLLGAFELLADRDQELPFEPTLGIAPKVQAELFQRKLITRSVTYGGSNIIVMAPPLVINKAQIETMFAIFSEAIAAVERQL